MLSGSTWLACLAIAQRKCLLGSSQKDSDGCVAVESMDGKQCLGLQADMAAATLERCEAACCEDEACDVWQFHDPQGCFRGRSQSCLTSFSRFGRELRGARIRGTHKHHAIFARQSSLGRLEMSWETGQNAFSYSTFQAVEPYLDGPEYLQVVNDRTGETYLLRRTGPLLEQLDVSISCWAPDRLPQDCCTRSSASSCWSTERFYRRCCLDGLPRPQPNSVYIINHKFVNVTRQLSLAELRVWDAMVPKAVVSEAEYDAKRHHWRVGHNEPSAECAYRLPYTAASIAEAGLNVYDGPAGIRKLISLLLSRNVPLSKTFVNIGAGNCGPPDPLYHTVVSADAAGFAGLAVESNSSSLDNCLAVLQRSPATVKGVNIAVDPITIAMRLRPELAWLFPTLKPRWPLDVLVLDVDGCDCLLAEEMLQLLVPKILVIEMAFHIPPPFMFTAQHDRVRSDEWLDALRTQTFTPTAGCSLTYALRRFQLHGLHLLRLTDVDAVFVHESILAVVADAYGVQFPQDEFECYRRSRLWMQLPIAHVREWFFDAHPASSLSKIWENITWASRLGGRPDAPFTLQY